MQVFVVSIPAISKSGMSLKDALVNILQLNKHIRLKTIKAVVAHVIKDNKFGVGVSSKNQVALFYC